MNRSARSAEMPAPRSSQQQHRGEAVLRVLPPHADDHASGRRLAVVDPEDDVALERQELHPIADVSPFRNPAVAFDKRANLPRLWSCRPLPAAEAARRPPAPAHRSSCCAGPLGLDRETQLRAQGDRKIAQALTVLTNSVDRRALSLPASPRLCASLAQLFEQLEIAGRNQSLEPDRCRPEPVRRQPVTCRQMRLGSGRLCRAARLWPSLRAAADGPSG